MTRVFWIFVAGGAGSAARYAVGVWAVSRLPPGFPYGTLIVNALGCFLTAVCLQWSAQASWDPEWRVAATVGFLGGFTTYSAFNQETLHLLQAGPASVAVANIAVTLTSGLAAGWLGLTVARQLTA